MRISTPRLIGRDPRIKPLLGEMLNRDYVGVHTDGRRLGDVLAGMWLLGDTTSSSANLVTGVVGRFMGAGNMLFRGGVRFGPLGYFDTRFILPPILQATNITWLCTMELYTAGANCIFGNRFGGTSSPLQFIKLDFGGFSFYRGGSNPAISWALTGSIGPQAMAVTKKGTGFITYKNAVQIGSGTTNIDMDANPVYIGGDPGGEYSENAVFFASIFSVALSPAAIAAWYSEPYPADMWEPVGPRRVYYVQTVATGNRRRRVLMTMGD
jgi:hypothetical protein